MKTLLGKKVGMTQIFNEDGAVVPAVSYTHLTLPTNSRV